MRRSNLLLWIIVGGILGLVPIPPFALAGDAPDYCQDPLALRSETSLLLLSDNSSSQGLRPASRSSRNDSSLARSFEESSKNGLGHCIDRGQLRKSFLGRFFDAYVQGIKGNTDTGESSAATQRRLPPAPFSSPPFPMSEHVGPAIGTPDSTPDNLPLMRAISDTDMGKMIRNSRISIYGWIVPSFNASTSRNTNIPLTYGITPNSAQLSQAVLTIERGLDTAQTNHLDWGFRATNLYGIDYRYTAAKGILGDQLFGRNQLYGYDPMEFYGQVYVPWVAQGMVVKVGRFMSPADIEAQLAPNNYLVTHSVMFTYDPFTFMGILATVRLNSQWMIDLGVHGGNDMAVWSDSAQPNAHVMVKWLASDNNDAIWLGANSVGRGKYTNGHDNLQHMVGVWSHRFNETFHMMTEAYYAYQFDAAKGGTCIFGPTRPFASGGGCGPTISGLSDAIGAVNYFQVKLSDKDYMTIRNDALADLKGQRSGFKTVYSSHTVGWSHWISNELIVRPELRYDHSWSVATPYDNGARKDQFVFLTDIIVKF